MKVIKFSQILTFLILVTIVIIGSFLSLIYLNIFLSREMNFDFINLLSFFILFYFYLFIVFNLFLRSFPIPEGFVPDNSKAEFIYHLHTLFHLLFFQPFILSNILPIPIRRKYYQLLGGKLGFNTYPSGVILDPQFVQIGESCIIGYKSLICPHIMVNNELSHMPIKIGNNVTLSVGALVYGGCTIEDNAKILPHSVVNPNTHIKKDEVWGGIPAKKIR